MPTYVTFDIEDRDKAARLLEQLSKRVPLKEGDVFGLGTHFDAYRLPDYKQHAAVCVQLSALCDQAAAARGNRRQSDRRGDEAGNPASK